MYQFKEGDRVKILKNCEYIKAGEVYTVIYSFDELVVKNSDGFICHHQKYWQLVEPKERTIEDVEVGDVLLDSIKTEWRVLDVFVNCIVLIMGTQVYPQIFAIEFIKNAGWKIKQPEPEKKECCKCDCHVQFTVHK